MSGRAAVSYISIKICDGGASVLAIIHSFHSVLIVNQLESQESLLLTWPISDATLVAEAQPRPLRPALVDEHVRRNPHDDPSLWSHAHSSTISASSVAALSRGAVKALQFLEAIR